MKDKISIILHRPAAALFYGISGDNTLTRILSSVAFWNGEGPGTFEQNLAGTLGSEDTQKFARESESYEAWVTYMIECDIQTFLNGHNVSKLQYAYEGGEYQIFDDKGYKLCTIKVN